MTDEYKRRHEAGDNALRQQTGKDALHRAPEEETLRREIIATALQMNALGINQGKAGNVSARCPRHAGSGAEAVDRARLPPLTDSGAAAADEIAPGDKRLPSPSATGAGGEGLSAARSVRKAPNIGSGFLITPSGLPYDRTQPADIAFMPLDAGDEHDFIGPMLPSSEWRFHRDIYAARPDIGAIVHTHGIHATALACLGRGIPAFHYMVAAAGGHDIRCATYATFGTQALSDHALEALRKRDACLLAHHGAIALGPTLERALALAVEVEALARMYCEALQLGEPATLPEDEMRRVVKRFRTYGQRRG